MSITKYELMRLEWLAEHPQASELQAIEACLQFAKGCNLYRVETELQRQFDVVSDEVATRENNKIKA